MTQDETERLDKLSRSGCVVSRVFNNVFAQAEVHHLTRGGRRLGHRYTIPLSPWFHRGVPDPGMTPEQMREHYGPSFAEGKRTFENHFDTEERLLEEADKWLGILESPLFYDHIGLSTKIVRRRSTSTSWPGSTPMESPPAEEPSTSGSSSSSPTLKSPRKVKSSPSSRRSSRKNSSPKRT